MRRLAALIARTPRVRIGARNGSREIRPPAAYRFPLQPAAIVVGPLRCRAQIDPLRNDGIARQRNEPLVIVRDQDHGFRTESAFDELGGGLDHLIGLQQTRHVPRELVKNARALFPVRGDARLITQARRHLSDHERHDEHHDEREQILHVAHGKGEARLDEKVVEAGDAHEGREDSGSRPKRTAITTTSSRNSMTMLAGSK
jgi:hypothetical protein